MFCTNPSFVPFALHNPWIEQAIHGLSYKAWIHALRSAIHGLRKSMLCAQHIHCVLWSWFLRDRLFHLLHHVFGADSTSFAKEVFSTCFKLLFHDLDLEVIIQGLDFKEQLHSN